MAQFVGEQPKAAGSVGVYFYQGMKNPPDVVAEATLDDDPIFGNSFDGMELDPRPLGIKGVIQSASKLCLEFVSLVIAEVH